MKVVRPIQATDANFTSSIAEPDTAGGEVEWTAGTYTMGQQRIMSSTHMVYEVVAASTTDQPDIGAALAVPTWIKVRATNKWSVFDSVIGNGSTADDSIQVAMDTGQLVNAVAGFGLVNVDAVNVTVTDPVEGVVYDTDVDMLDLTNVVDFYSWFFDPIAKNNQFILSDLPAYPDAEVVITATGTGSITVGELTFGQQLELGVANYGTGLQLLVYTDKATDEFGSLLPLQVRRSAKLVDFDVKIERTRVNYVFNTLANLEAVPCVYFGDNAVDDPTLIFGLYLDGQINISTPSLCDCTLQVRGLT